MSNRLFFLFLITSFLLVNCKSTGDDTNSELVLENEHLYSILQNWYLWNDQIDPNLDVASFATNQELLDQVRFSQLDRWSSISDAVRFTTYYDEGTYFGYGFSYGWDESGDLRIRFIYDDSPFGEAGIKRGWKLLEIDGADVRTITDFSGVFGEDEVGYTQSFKFENEERSQIDYQISKDIVTINPVLHSDTLSIGTETIGYLVFNNFINPAREELDAAFNLFETTGISRLILDLRYNGGGQISVANYLANYIVPPFRDGATLYKYVHNDSQTQSNSYYELEKNGQLNINELVVLTTQGTASASELVLNGLKPLINVTHIGEGNTYGKPVGSYSWYNLDETEIYSIISFRFVNSNDEGDFFDGITPDFTACDDLQTDFGNKNESFLASAIEYIETGQTGGCDFITKSVPGRPELPQEQPGPILIVNQ